jgi:hypothetical protein
VPRPSLGSGGALLLMRAHLKVVPRVVGRSRIPILRTRYTVGVISDRRLNTRLITSAKLAD